MKDIIPVILYSALKDLTLTAFGASIIKLFWKMSEKKEFSEYVASICDLSQNIKESGIICVKYSFQDINWKKFYNEATDIDLVLYHGLHTLSTCADHIREVSRCKKPPTIRIKFPDHSDKILMNQISEFEQYGNDDDLIRDIKNSIDVFKKMSQKISKYFHQKAYFLFQYINQIIDL